MTPFGRRVQPQQGPVYRFETPLSQARRVELAQVPAFVVALEQARAAQAQRPTVNG